MNPRAELLEAGAHALAAEAAHAEELTLFWRCQRHGRSRPRPKAIARIDVAASHAHRASRRWLDAAAPDRVKPCLEIDAGQAPSRRGGASSEVGDRFVANDLSMGRNDRLWLITGPNMGGKVDLPAPDGADRGACAGRQLRALRARAKVGIVDRLFSRVGRFATISRAAARPSWSRWSRPRRSSRRRRRKAS